MFKKSLVMYQKLLDPPKSPFIKGIKGDFDSSSLSVGHISAYLQEVCY
jgi:hypothetical protein